MIDLIRKVVALKRLADEHGASWEHVQRAYDRGASLPGLIRVYTFGTQTKLDDKIDDAIEALLGELHQTAYNVEEQLRGAVVSLDALAGFVGELRAFLEHAQSGSLRDLLE